MRIAAVVSALVLLPALASSTRALACDCPRPPPTEGELRTSAAVVVASVDEVDAPVVHSSGLISTGPVTIRLSVTRAFSGAKAGDKLVLSRSAGVSDCDYDLPKGTTHLLYLKKGDHGALEALAPHCARNRPLAAAADEIKALEEITGAPRAVAPPPPPAPSASPAPRGGCAGCSATPGMQPFSPLVLLFLALATCSITGRRRRDAHPH